METLILLWRVWYYYGYCDIPMVILILLWWLWHYYGDSDIAFVILIFLWWLWYYYGGYDISMVIVILPWWLWYCCGGYDITIVSLILLRWLVRIIFMAVQCIVIILAPFWSPTKHSCPIIPFWSPIASPLYDIYSLPFDIHLIPNIIKLCLALLKSTQVPCCWKSAQFWYTVRSSIAWNGMIISRTLQKMQVFLVQSC